MVTSPQWRTLISTSEAEVPLCSPPTTNPFSVRRYRPWSVGSPDKICQTLSPRPGRVSGVVSSASARRWAWKTPSRLVLAVSTVRKKEKEREREREERETESNEEERPRFYLPIATFPANHSVSPNSRNFRVEVFFAVQCFDHRARKKREYSRKLLWIRPIKVNKHNRNFPKFWTVRVT